MPGELLLEPLVCIVDAKLFKAVAGELLKAIDVKDRYAEATALLACE